MNIRLPVIPFLLALLGIIPMMVAAFGLKFFPEEHDWQHIFISYSAVISAFLGGIHWGFATSHYSADRGSIPKRLITWSNVIALSSWSALLVKEFETGVAIIFVVLMAQWFVDAFILNEKIIPKWFRQIRNIISPIVVMTFIFVIYG
jgi:hypothetical protein